MSSARLFSALVFSSVDRASAPRTVPSSLMERTTVGNRLRPAYFSVGCILISSIVRISDLPETLHDLVVISALLSGLIMLVLQSKTTDLELSAASFSSNVVSQK